jgi:hypothetical protein
VAPAFGPREAIRAARPGLDPDSPTFHAALVLLAGPGAQFNVHRIARQTGCPGGRAAACARRLFDNGVWGGGRAEYAWSSPADPRFWDDVGVAEGRLCRRGSGARTEWAPAGAWRKAYDYVSCESGVAVRYLAEEADDAGPATACPAPRFTEPSARPAPRFEARALAGMAPAHATSLFPDAAWLC